MLTQRYAAFAKEAPKSQLTDHLAPLHTFQTCQCPPHASSRVPNCTCKAPPTNVSPLFSVRWKRLIVDEGHIHGDDKTRVSQLASLLSVERRWLVSGTPTTDLLGLSFGSQSEAVEGNADMEEADVEDEKMGELRYPSEEASALEQDDVGDSPLSGSINGLTEPQDFTVTSTPAPQRAPTLSISDDGTPLARIWTPNDRENLRRLGKMITSFLKVEEFSNSEGTRLFNESVVGSLFGETGPQLRAVQVLKQVMGSVMIRHRYVMLLHSSVPSHPKADVWRAYSWIGEFRIEDVERDEKAILPPLKQETVLLDLDPLAITSYNAFQAIIAINAVDSERVDQV